jgi:hypothetical protein
MKLVLKIGTTTLLVILCAFASGCGGPSAEEIAAEREQLSTPLANEAKKRETTQAQNKGKQAADACRSEAREFIRALQGLDGRINVGISYVNYGEELGEAGATYRRMDVSDQPPACASALVAGETALDQFNNAQDVWGDCIFDDYDFCDTDSASFQDELQGAWSKGSDALEELERNFDKLPSDMTDRSTIGDWSTAVPRASGFVKGSLYGVAEQLFCKGSTDADRTEACTKLQEVLAEGVEQDEDDDLNDAIRKLDESLGIAPAEVK